MSMTGIVKKAGQKVNRRLLANGTLVPLVAASAIADITDDIYKEVVTIKPGAATSAVRSPIDEVTTVTPTDDFGDAFSSAFS